MTKTFWLSVLAGFKGLLSVTIAIYFFLIPFGILIYDLSDPALKDGGMPRFTYRWHKNLSPKFEAWAIERVENKAAESLNMYDISGTEWPVFSSVYFLWATEELQKAWEEDPGLSEESPVKYSAGAIEAAVTLISDPNHASWVERHWGDDYLYQENIFYRMLLISGLLSYQNLTQNNQHEPLLRSQIDTLSQELESSPYGLLDDYPGECYPIDILPAIAVIKRSENLFEYDHSGFVESSLRGFSGTRLDQQIQLPAYIADSKTGVGYGPARGVGMSYMLIWAPEVWPSVAESWYSRYETHFWSQNRWVAGVREYAEISNRSDWAFEIDAGPIVGGYGTAASAFGIGAAKANGRIDHAYPLSLEALVFTWPLLNGTLLTTRPLANLSDAPFIGETALLFTFTRQTHTDEIVLP
ncbi:MAG: hypothetical protein AAF902_22795, partial [Chloroflexota bacterium]